MTDLERLHKLAQMWREHIANTPGHIPARDGMERGQLDTHATYDTNLAQTYVRCCAPGCDWEHDTREDR